MAKKLASPLKGLVDSIKAETKAERSASATLKKIIDDYCLSGEFDAYLEANKNKLPDYISDQSKPRTSRFRASQVGGCMQALAFDILKVPKQKSTSPRPARQMRALHNGTFMHLRYHMLFDALEEKGLVQSLYVEDLIYSEEYDLSGTVDRVIQFPYLGQIIRAVVDFKSIKSEYFNALIKPETPHAKQQHAYDLLKKYNADVWMMLYENKDSHELKLFDFPYSDLTKHQVIRDLRAVNEYVEVARAGVPVEDRTILPLTVTWCRYCPYDAACLEQHPNLREEQAKIGDDEEPLF